MIMSDSLTQIDLRMILKRPLHWKDDEIFNKSKIQRRFHKNEHSNNGLKTALSPTCGFSHSLLNTDYTQPCFNSDPCIDMNIKDILYVEKQIHNKTVNGILSSSSFESVVPVLKSSLPRCSECAAGKSIHHRQLKDFATQAVVRQISKFPLYGMVFKNPHNSRMVSKVSWFTPET